MTFLEAKKIVEGEGYRVVKNVDPETLRERIAREELEEAKRIAEAAGYTVINENDLTNPAYSDANGKLINEFTDLSYEDYRAIVKDHLVRLGLDRATADEYIMSYAESIEDNYNNKIDAVDTAQEIIDSNIDESCSDSKKKKNKKKGKKSGFVPFWARKKDDKKIDEAFGDAEGTTFTSICEKYVKNGYFLTLSTQIGFKPAINKLLDEVKKAIGSGISDKYYATFAARLNNMKSPTQVLYTVTNAMLAGQGMDSAAGTNASAIARRRRSA